MEWHLTAVRLVSAANVVAALPASLGGRVTSLPGGVSVLFIGWVLVLPFVIPWRPLFHG